MGTSMTRGGSPVQRAIATSFVVCARWHQLRSPSLQLGLFHAGSRWELCLLGSFTKISVTTNFSPALTIPPFTVFSGKSLLLL